MQLQETPYCLHRWCAYFTLAWHDISTMLGVYTLELTSSEDDLLRDKPVLVLLHGYGHGIFPPDPNPNPDLNNPNPRCGDLVPRHQSFV